MGGAVRIARALANPGLPFERGGGKPIRLRVSHLHQRGQRGRHRQGHHQQRRQQQPAIAAELQPFPGRDRVHAAIASVMCPR